MITWGIPDAQLWAGAALIVLLAVLAVVSTPGDDR